MLIKAEQQEVYSKRKIEHIRNEFGFKLPMGDDKKEDTSSLQIILGD
jgi:hypothetical protein